MQILTRPIELNKIVVVRFCNGSVHSAKVIGIEGSFAKVAINVGSGVKLIEYIRYE